MRLPVLGATGRTGGQLPAQALEQGHEISALTRHAEACSRYAPAAMQRGCWSGWPLLPSAPPVT
jgi:uncharacterized protein YbjT (DUF2867 family)